ncbi:MAG: hypothetical protein AAB543_00385 [Pseudomonadota bacterium]
MMNTYERDVLAPPPGILNAAVSANLVFAALGAAADAPDRTALPVDDKTLTETKPLAPSIRRWRGETASA